LKYPPDLILHYYLTTQYPSLSLNTLLMTSMIRLSLASHLFCFSRSKLFGYTSVGISRYSKHILEMPLCRHSFSKEIEKASLFLFVSPPLQFFYREAVCNILFLACLDNLPSVSGPSIGTSLLIALRKPTNLLYTFPPSSLHFALDVQKVVRAFPAFSISLRMLFWNSS
jgi:hypothetical protein